MSALEDGLKILSYLVSEVRFWGYKANNKDCSANINQLKGKIRDAVLDKMKDQNSKIETEKLNRLSVRLEEIFKEIKE